MKKQQRNFEITLIFSIFVLLNSKIKIPMLRYKNRTNIGELQQFFSSSESAIHTLFRELRLLKIYNKTFQSVNKVNTRHTGRQVFTLLLLFPLFAVKDISCYAKSSLFRLYKCGKDVFYEFLNNPLIDWRKLSLQVTKQLINRVQRHSYFGDEVPVRCLIADDTDLPKRGRRFELLSRIFSHVTHTFNYGFKGLFLGLHDGKSFFGLDFSLHGEKGKDAEKPYGLTKKQTKKRFSGKRPQKGSGQQRVNEYFKTKTEMLIEMIRRLIASGIRFDYLLTDSWFTNFELIKFIVTRKIGCFFLGMVKNGNTKYTYHGKLVSFSGILKILKHSIKASDCKKFNCKFYEATVELKGIPVKLFFCKTGKKTQWHGLLTTNTDLIFEKAFEIYATRWTIEVFFKECKQLLRLGKCESRHFEAQIAATTLCMLQYNMLSTVKRFAGYESLGALFRQANADTVELTVKERILLIIKEILTEFSQNMHLGIDYFLEHIFSEYELFENAKNCETLANTA
jgi:hypothetical protein